MSNNIKKQEVSYTARHKLLEFNIFQHILTFICSCFNLIVSANLLLRQNH